MLPLIPRIARALDVDRAVSLGLLASIWSAAAGPLTALIIAVAFSPQLQGYYYTFLNLLALQIVLELGLAGVVTVFASHEWSKLRLDGRGAVVGDPQARSRLASLARFALWWYASVAAVLALGLLAAGAWFFGLSRQETAVEWHGPWMALCALAAINALFLPLWALLQGCGQVAKVNFFRLGEGIIKAAVLWTAMLNGAELWAIPASLAASLAWTALFLLARYRAFAISLLGAPAAGGIDWKREILPVQWRIGVSWVSGYLMFALITPALFHFHGPVVAGQMGMTWALVSGVIVLASSWLHARTPGYGMLISSERYSELDRVALRATAMTVLIAVIGELCVIALIAWLNAAGHPFAERVLPLAPVAVLAAAEITNLGFIAQAGYLRAFKQELFMPVSLVTGAGVGISVMLLAGPHGPMGALAAYFSGIALSLAWSSVIFYRFRRSLLAGRPA